MIRQRRLHMRNFMQRDLWVTLLISLGAAAVITALSL
jgi:hypothetical protein